MKLSWIRLTGGNGYGAVGEHLYEALARAGATNLPESSFGWDALIAVHPPTLAHLVGPHPRPDLVYHTMVETDHIPHSWVEIINRAGLLWVPSDHSADIFCLNGVDIPIIKTGYGICVRPVRREPHAGPFRVLAWADSLYSRKNALMAIEAFIQSDLPNAELEVKLNLEGIRLPNVRWEDSRGVHNNILIIHDNWSRERLDRWLYSGDVGIYLSGGEGYGLMPMEMMATGLPVITPIHTGLREYLSPDSVLYVPSEHRESDYFRKSFGIPYATEYAPSLDVAIEQLQWAYQYRYGWLSDLGVAGADSIQTNTWDSVGVSAYRQLAKHYGIPSVRDSC